jgi:hypothetical protein
MKKAATKKKAVPAVETQFTGARDFFASELRAVMEKRRVDANHDAFEYLVQMLMGFMSSNSFFARNAEGKLEDNFLVGLYAEYLQGSPEVQRTTLRRLGDICLMVTGYFPDSLNRKLVDVDYYSGMGGAAYSQLSTLQMGSPVFKELSVKFRDFSNVLAEMSDRSGLNSNTDLLRVYERWITSGNDRLKEILAEKGIETPMRLEIKTRH